MYKKCWQCGEEIDIELDIDKTYREAYDKGYLQAMRDMKLSGGFKK